MNSIRIRLVRRCACFAAFCVGSAIGLDLASAEDATSSLWGRVLPPAGLVAPTGRPIAQGQRGFNQQLGYGSVAVGNYAGPGWWHVASTPERQLRINDRILVRVDELFSVSLEGEMQSRKDAQYSAVLTDWIRLIGLKTIKPAPQSDGDPTVGGTLKQLFRAEGDMSTKESLALNITCTVADIRPNGDVVLEGHKQIQVNDESWQVSLSGVCRYQDIGPDNTVLSKHIANLIIQKRDSGHVRDSYKRGWLSRWIDEWSPF